MTAEPTVIHEIIARLTALEEGLDTTRAHHGEYEDIAVVDNIGQITDPFSNQIVLVRGDPGGQAGGRLYVYDGNAAQFLPIT